MLKLMPSTDFSRADQRLLMSQARKNLDAFLDEPEKIAALKTVLYEVATDRENRQRHIAAASLLRAIGDAVAQQVRLAEVTDKMDRLDAGGVTERVEVKRVILEGE